MYQGDRKQRKPSWRGQRGGTLPRRYCQFLTIRNASSRVSRNGHRHTAEPACHGAAWGWRHKGSRRQQQQSAERRCSEIVVKALEVERKLLARRGISALVCRPSEVTEYIFSVSSDSFEWLVRLRFSDFVAFDALLQRNFEPHERRGLEPLPSRTFLTRNDSQDLIEHRKCSLESYLNALNKSPTVMRSGALQHFLKFPDEEVAFDGWQALASVRGPQPATSSGGAGGGSAFAVCHTCMAVLLAGIPLRPLIPCGDSLRSTLACAHIFVAHFTEHSAPCIQTVMTLTADAAHCARGTRSHYRCRGGPLPRGLWAFSHARRHALPRERREKSTRSIRILPSNDVDARPPLCAKSLPATVWSPSIMLLSFCLL